MRAILGIGLLLFAGIVLAEEAMSIDINKEHTLVGVLIAANVAQWAERRALIKREERHFDVQMGFIRQIEALKTVVQHAVRELAKRN